MKAYKLFDLASKQIIYSRDIVFHEMIFPFHDPNNSDSTDPFSQTVIPVA